MELTQTTISLRSGGPGKRDEIVLYHDHRRRIVPPRVQERENHRVWRAGDQRAQLLAAGMGRLEVLSLCPVYLGSRT